MDAIKYVLNSHFKNIYMIFAISKFEYFSRVRNNRLGILWIFMNPLIQILLYWFIFGIGIKGATRGDFPYIVWVLSGVIPWFFISKSISTGSQAISGNIKIVTRTSTPIVIFPTISMIVEFYNFIIMIVISIIAIAINNHLNINFFMFLYYLISMIFFLFAINSMLSAFVAIITDIKYLIQHGLKLAFWISPIIWDISSINTMLQAIIQLNPINYIIIGYREALTGLTIPIQIPYYHAYFWVITILIFLIGVQFQYSYKKGTYDFQ